MDKLNERMLFKQQRTNRSERNPERNSLYGPGVDSRVRGHHDHRVHEHCLYTQAAIHRKTAYTILGGVALSSAVWWLRREHPSLLKGGLLKGSFKAPRI